MVHKARATKTPALNDAKVGTVDRVVETMTCLILSRSHDINHHLRLLMKLLTGVIFPKFSNL